MNVGQLIDVHLEDCHNLKVEPVGYILAEKILQYLKISIAEDCEVKEGDMLTNLGFTAHRVDTVKDGFAVHETHEGQKFTELKYAKLIHRPERNIISADIVGVKGE
jgi:hypothetical protein